jgi:hypothetical protein
METMHDLYVSLYSPLTTSFLSSAVNAPLYDMEGSPDFSVHGCVQNWMKAGGRGDQINIGLPFYGRSFAGSGLTGLGQVHSGAGDMITWSDDEGTPQYFNIVNKISQFTSVRDEQTHTQIAYNSAGLVSYDDERAICDKTEYAMDHNLNGYIIWEISGDILPDLSTPLLDATNDRLNNPNIKCDGSAGGSSGASPSKNDSPPPDYNGKWYPQAGSCLQSDGTIPDWIKEADLFNHEDECCKEVRKLLLTVIAHFILLDVSHNASFYSDINSTTPFHQAVALALSLRSQPSRPRTLLTNPSINQWTVSATLASTPSMAMTEPVLNAETLLFTPRYPIGYQKICSS